MTDLVDVVASDDLTSLSGAELNPYDYAELWRYLYLNATQVPGLVADCAGSNPRKWDKQDGKGQSGATVVYNGDGLAEFSAKVQLGWRIPGGDTPQQQFAAWESFKPMLRPPTEKNPDALSIYYPNLMLLPVPIVAVVVKDVKGPKQVFDGIWEWEILFTQYRAAKKAGAKPAGAKTDGSGGTSTGDAADEMIDSLVSELTGSSTGWGEGG